MIKQYEIGSVRFEKTTIVRMVRVVPFDSSNANDPGDRREIGTTLVSKTELIPEAGVPKTIQDVLA